MPAAYSIPATPQPAGRPVTHDEPACSETGYRFTRDRQPHPDYGCVFWTDNSDYQGPKHRYDFSRDGARFCMSGAGEVITDGWLNVGARSYRIAGPSNAQAAADRALAAGLKQAEAALNSSQTEKAA